jgi:hypothetical protein
VRVRIFVSFAKDNHRCHTDVRECRGTSAHTHTVQCRLMDGRPSTLADAFKPLFDGVPADLSRTAGREKAICVADAPPALKDEFSFALEE